MEGGRDALGSSEREFVDKKLEKRSLAAACTLTTFTPHYSSTIHRLLFITNSPESYIPTVG